MWEERAGRRAQLVARAAKRRADGEERADVDEGAASADLPAHEELRRIG